MISISHLIALFQRRRDKSSTIYFNLFFHWIAYPTSLCRQHHLHNNIRKTDRLKVMASQNEFAVAQQLINVWWRQGFRLRPNLISFASKSPNLTVLWLLHVCLMWGFWCAHLLQHCRYILLKMVKRIVPFKSIDILTVRWVCYNESRVTTKVLYWEFVSKKHLPQANGWTIERNDPKMRKRLYWNIENLISLLTAIINQLNAHYDRLTLHFGHSSIPTFSYVVLRSFTFSGSCHLLNFTWFLWKFEKV